MPRLPCGRVHYEMLCFLVGGVYDDLGGFDDVHVHLHSHLEEEELRVGLQTVHLQHLGIVGVVHAEPQVRVDARGEVAQDDRVLAMGMMRLPLKR